ncbi:RpoE-regulated lipoprotein [Pantoea sp. LMR881]|uniref:RpoE-regulated lipoprotein n=1 Tax=Pantoea sp. LMR881 TaxID=3014336 RepID=UPI0022AE8A9A|nr:RpoE-regulated lipoprotein [Pantoea sp. LMR881]MCZ4060523.1 RpoE-regulated lipoprotein [Pantoea sp. LMR881]
MKAVRSTLLIAAVTLGGCASSGSGTDSSQQVSWWNPLSYHWSSALPWNWFGASLTVTDQGVGGLNATTAMTESAIKEALNGQYDLRQGMRSQNGQVVSFWQAREDDKVQLVIYGQSQVERIEVMDRNITSSDGSKIGDAFGDKYSKAYNNCTLSAGLDNRDVECRVPASEHLRYVYSGEWHGPEGLMPSDDTLKSWKMSKIIWRR